MTDTQTYFCPMLSKSKYVRGTQCHKSLWLYKHKKHLREISASQQAIFDSGTNAGLLAQELFPNGIDASEGEDWPNFQVARKTKELIQQGVTTIYEATFVYDDVLVAVDILVKSSEGWHAYEVKSSTHVKDTHFVDGSIQYYVIAGSGIDIKSFSMVTINKEYVRKGDIVVEDLFNKTDITDEVCDLQSGLSERISELKAVEQLNSEPEVEIGPHCGSPYPCDFSGYCWKGIPAYSVLNLNNSRGKEWELYDRGILDITDIPDDFHLNDKQRIQVDAALLNEPQIKKEAIQQFLNTLDYPLYHFDFETINSAVPLYDQSRPYQQIPFQYSLHVQSSKAASPIHTSFLAEGNGQDPREALIKRMIKDLGETGTILTYNMGFEKGVINKLAIDFPQYADALQSINARINDLAIPFRSYYYHTKDMRGSWSIKAVLPALVPHLSYNDLVIQEGGTASATFLSMTTGTFDGNITETRANLEAYCELDTLAMVEILKVLYGVTK